MPRTYLGLMTAGLPNLFIITGPQSPSVYRKICDEVAADYYRGFDLVNTSADTICAGKVDPQ